MLSDDGSKLSGRFYGGVLSELGLDDVTLVRLGEDSRIAGVLPRSLPSPSGDATVRILGANFPADVAADDIYLGPGVDVKALTSVRPDVLGVRVDVEESALPDSRNVSVGAATAMNAFAVYDGIDYVKVRPENGMARLGGVRFPKRFVQFEAVAFHRGQDGKRFTDDDIDLGPVKADWSLEEYHIRFDDDDLKYVGTIDQSGLFTPNIEGPNTTRRQNNNNTGDVWVGLTCSSPCLFTHYGISFRRPNRDARKDIGMKHLTARNRKAEAVLEYLEAAGGGVTALQERPPEYPPGCTTIFRRDGKSMLRAAPRVCAHPSSETSTTVTRAASGRHKCRTI